MVFGFISFIKAPFLPLLPFTAGSVFSTCFSFPFSFRRSFFTFAHLGEEFTFLLPGRLGPSFLLPLPPLAVAAAAFQGTKKKLKREAVDARSALQRHLLIFYVLQFIDFRHYANNIRSLRIFKLILKLDRTVLLSQISKPPTFPLHS